MRYYYRITNGGQLANFRVSWADLDVGRGVVRTTTESLATPNSPQ